MKRTLFYIIIVQLLLFSCQNDRLEEIEFNSTRRQFMEFISTYDDWQSDWEKITKLGTPLYNEASIIYTLPQKGYYIVPILSGNEIINLAFYSLNIKNENHLTTSSPVVVSKKDAKDNIFIQGFLNSKIFDLWKEKGYIIEFERNDEIFKGHTPLSQFDTRGYHIFCFSSYLYYSATENQLLELQRRIDELWGYFVLLYENQYIEFTHQGDFTYMLIPADIYNWDDARKSFSEFMTNYTSKLGSLHYISKIDVQMLAFKEWTDGEHNISRTPVTDKIYSLKSTLTPSQKKLLEKALTDFIDKDPAYKAMYDRLVELEVKLNFNIDFETLNHLNAPAGYLRGSISFLNTSSITEFCIEEEMIHAVQDNEFYGNIMFSAQKNVEFEAKIVRDMITRTKDEGGMTVGSAGHSTEFMNAYDQLLENFTVSRFHILCGHWLGYSGSSDPNFIPEVALKYTE